MKLDDRPVIDQLLNPTPLQVLTDIEDQMSEWLLDHEETLSRAEYKGAEAMLERFSSALFVALEDAEARL